MAKKPQVKCLYCGKAFYREDEEYIQINRRYSHKKCQEYRDKIHQLAQQVLNQYYIEQRVEKNIKDFANKGMSLEDIYETAKYWYCIQKKQEVFPEKSQGGIGIVPYIYSDYIQYKEQQEKIAQTNRGKKVSDYVNKNGPHIEAKIDPSWKIRGVKFFNL